jgi:DNA topoisomerase-1
VITAQLGRYGPYVQKGSESRSLEHEEQVFTVSVSEALQLLAQPKTRGRRAAAPAAPLRELGPDLVSGQLITLREGRFGPYVTDGETNASLRKGDEPSTITVERAQELLQLRRERGPVKKKRAVKKVAKKAPAKQPKTKKTAKKTARKAASKKSRAKPAATKKAPAPKQGAAPKKAAPKKAPTGATAKPRQVIAARTPLQDPS